MKYTLILHYSSKDKELVLWTIPCPCVATNIADAVGKGRAIFDAMAGDPDLWSAALHLTPLQASPLYTYAE